jgi:uncharacterized protein YbjT (DUF2867 family)
MILVVGATGRLGRKATELLVDRGHVVRAACRSPAKAHELRASGFEPIAIDLRIPSSFPNALSGVEQVVVAVQALTARRSDSIAEVDCEGHRQLIDAARSAGVKRFVYVSAQGASSDHPAAFSRAKAAIEEHLAASGMEFAILRPSAFMDLYAHELIGKSVIAGKRVVLLGDGRTVRNLVAIDDVAMAIAAAVDGRLPMRTVEVVGASNVDDRQIAALYGRLANRPVRVTSLSSRVVNGIARAIGPFHAGVRNLMMFGAQNAEHGNLTADASHMPSILGREPQGIEDFVTQQVARAPAN